MNGTEPGNEITKPCSFYRVLRVPSRASILGTQPCSYFGLHDEKDPMLVLKRCCQCVQILNNFILELEFSQNPQDNGAWS